MTLEQQQGDRRAFLRVSALTLFGLGALSSSGCGKKIGGAPYTTLTEEEQKKGLTRELLFTKKAALENLKNGLTSSQNLLKEFMDGYQEKGYAWIKSHPEKITELKAALQMGSRVLANSRNDLSFSTVSEKLQILLGEFNYFSDSLSSEEKIEETWNRLASARNAEGDLLVVGEINAINLEKGLNTLMAVLENDIHALSQAKEQQKTSSSSGGGGGGSAVVVHSSYTPVYSSGGGYSYSAPAARGGFGGLGGAGS